MGYVTEQNGKDQKHKTIAQRNEEFRECPLLSHGQKRSKQSAGYEQKRRTEHEGQIEAV